LVKNSETEISRWRAPISTADTAGFGCVATGLVFRIYHSYKQSPLQGLKFSL